MSFLLGQRSFQLTFSSFVLFRFFTLINFVTMTLFVCLHHESSTNRMIYKNGCLSDRSLFMSCVVYVGFYDRFLPTITNCPGVSRYFTRWLWGSPWRLYSVPVNHCHPRTHTSIKKTKHHFSKTIDLGKMIKQRDKKLWSSGGNSILCSWFVRTTDLYEIWISTSDCWEIKPTPWSSGSFGNFLEFLFSI